ncbi:hypothetical protein [Fulvivirga ligni]|uniref:hypothetical protein n=1 Tax=Fulvivirga ligni TaxID=2904246 RepID=UPI001F1FD396|nr:hypothetical protein [Fulvivirga ligni]UII20405.1 hypothetical protein LVD16_21425 [Fulvivirga ligni]
MDKQNRSGFEEQWLNAFEDAEVDVPDHVWDKIELDLVNAKNGEIRRRLFWYQMVAAASIIFALTVGGVYTNNWYNLKHDGAGLNNPGAVADNAINDERAGSSELANGLSNESPSNIEDDKNASTANKEVADQLNSDNVALLEQKNNSSNVSSDQSLKNTHDVQAGAVTPVAANDSGVNEASINEGLNGTDQNATSAEFNNSDLNNGFAFNQKESNGALNHSGANESNEHDKINEVMNLDENKTELVANSSNNASDNQVVNAVVNDNTSSVKPEVVAIEADNTSIANNYAANESVSRELASESLSELDKRFEYLDVDTAMLDREMKMVPWYAYVPVKRAKDKTSSEDGLWADIGVSAGRFNPNIGSSNDQVLANMDFEGNGLAIKRSPNFSEEAVGQSMNVGVNLGKRVSRKLLVQGGVSYLQQQATSVSDVVATNNSFAQTSKKVTSFNSIDNESSSDALTIEFTKPYEVVNTYELVSVPLQAGYILLDRKFNVTLLSGIANNILIKNTYDGSDGDIEDVTVDAGDNSPYKTYQISGLLGSEFSYELNNHYTISLLPQLRQALTSVTKSETDYESRPTVLEIGFRFKYIF